MKKHSHNFEHSHTHLHEEHNLWTAFFLNFSFVFVEVIAGIYSNSIALLSDAIHDFGDSITILFAIIISKYAQKGSDNQYTFGYSRFKLLGAFITNMILIIGCIFIVKQAIVRFQNPEIIDSKIMFFVAILGVIINSIAVFRMTKQNGIMERTIWLHLIEDALGWVAVLISSVLIYFFKWTFLDALLSIGIAVFIAYNVFKNFNELFKIFLLKIPDNFSITEIKSLLLTPDAVVDVHDIHLWTLDGYDVMLSCHLVLQDYISFPDAIILKDNLKQQLELIGINHATLDIENKTSALAHGELHHTP